MGRKGNGGPRFSNRFHQVRMMLNYDELYRASLAKWGREGQYDQAVEECAELIAVLKHFRRGKVNEDAVVNELADVVLMVGQLVFMFGEKRVERAVQEKIAKLEKLLLNET